MRYWVYDRQSRKPVGPFTAVQLRGINGFGPDTQVCPEGAKQWSPARSFNDLASSPPPRTNPPDPAPERTSPVTAAVEKKQVSGYRNRLVFGVCSALVLASAGGAYWWKQRNSPPGVASRYLAALKKSDYRSAYDLLSNSSKAHIDFTTFEQYQRRSGASEWDYANVVAESTATDHVLVEWSRVLGDKEFPDFLDVVNDRGSWCVAHSASLWEKAQELEARKDYAGLISAMQSIKSISPWTDTLDIGLAAAYVNKAIIESPGVSQQAMLREAVDVSRDVARRFPNSGAAQATLALALRNAELFEEAEENYTRALELAAKAKPAFRANVLAGRAICRLAQNEVKGAVADIREAKSLDPNNVEVKQLSARLGPYLRLFGGQKYPDAIAR